MRKFILKSFFILFSLLLSPRLAAQSENPSEKNLEIEAGIENTRLLFGKVTLGGHFTGKLNLSAYSEKLAYQYVRGTVGYQHSFGYLKLDANYFFGSSFNGFYYNTGANIHGNLKIFKKMLIDASIVPWYDSGYGYTTCYQGKIGWQMVKNISLNVGYTTVPEYRMAEHRILAGFDFSVSRLYVSPYLSIGTKENEGGKNIRVVMGFGYKF